VLLKHPPPKKTKEKSKNSIEVIGKPIKLPAVPQGHSASWAPRTPAPASSLLHTGCQPGRLGTDSRAQR